METGDRREDVDPGCGAHTGGSCDADMKKPGKTRISKEDWNKYVDAVRRNTVQGQDEDTRKGKRD
jgi:hypothetical protein